MKNLFLVILLLAFSFNSIAHDESIPLSIFSLLSDSNSYHEKKISTSGVLGVTYSGEYCLYSDVESMKNDVWMNSIIIDVDFDKAILKNKGLDELIGKYILIDGIYIKKFPKSSYSGKINSVIRLREYPLLKSLNK